MKKLLVYCFLLLFSFSCIEKKNDFGFYVYTPDGKLGNDAFGSKLKALSEFITPAQVNSFFSYRDSIHKNYNKLEFTQPIDSIKLSKFIKICSKNKNGGVLFNLKKNNKKLNFQILGMKIYNGKIELDTLNLDTDDTVKNYKDYGIQANSDNKIPYYDFNNRPYIYFDKAQTLVVLLAMRTFYVEDKMLYFYYGYSKSKTNQYHQSLLFSVKDNLENKTRSIFSDEYAFANRGGTCCPPQY